MITDVWDSVKLKLENELGKTSKSNIEMGT